MLDETTKLEIQEWAEGIRLTNNFLQEETNLGKYTAQAVELFHSAGQDDENEIVTLATKELSK